MKRIKILKHGKVTNQAELPNVEADAWLTQEIANGSFGKPERWTPEALCTPDELAKSLGTREVDGPIGSDAKVIEHHLPSEFTVVEEDMTAEIAAKQAAKSQRNAMRASLKVHRDRVPQLTAVQMSDAIKDMLKLMNLEDEV